MGDAPQDPLEGVVGIWDHQRVTTGTYTEQSVFTFHGEAVDDGSMDAAQFGQALLGYARMVRRTAQIVSPKAESAEVKVLTTRHGSFETLLSIAIDLTTVEAVRDWLMGANGQAFDRALNITVESGAVIGTVVGGAVGVGKWLRGRTISKREKIDATRERVVTEDGDELLALAKAVDVALDPAFRKGVMDFSEPTTAPGIDTVTLDGAAGGEEIAMADRNSFADADEDIDDVSTEVMLLKVRRVAFDEASWRFEYKPTDGPTVEFAATIADDDFLDDVSARRIVFGDGDAIDALVEIATPAKPRRGARRHFRVLRVNRVVPKEELEPQGLLTDDGTDLRDLD